MLAKSSTGAELNLNTSSNDIQINNKLGGINFQAPDESSGVDVITVAASIKAISEGEFTSTNNATKLVFSTGSSGTATEKLVINSQGNVEVSSGDLTVNGSQTVTQDLTVGAKLTIGATAVTGELIAALDSITLGQSQNDKVVTQSSNGVVNIGEESGNQVLNIASHDGVDGGLKLNGLLVKSSAAELNKLNNVSEGTVTESKAIIVDGNKNVTGLNNVSITNLSTDEITLNGTTLTSTAAELNRLSNVSAGSVKLNAAVVVDDNKDISGFRDVSVNRDVHVGGKINTNEVTSGNIIVKNNNIGVSDNEDVITVSSSQVTVEGALDASSIKINGNAVTASASDLNILTGTTLTSAELDSLSGSKKGETVANKVAVYDADGKLTSTSLETTNLTSSVSNLGNLSISGSSITSSDATGIDFADTILRTTEQ